MRNGKGTNSPSSPAMSTCPSSHIDHASSSKDPDRLLPIANVSRLMKKSLPTNAKISKEAKESVQECVSEFISFITCEASDKCLREKRKTINGDDLLWAMTTLGFENYISPLKNYLSKFRELEEDKSSMGRQAQEATNSTNDYHHHQQQVQQLNIMNNNNNGYMCVGDFDKVVNFGGNGEKQFDDGHMGVEDFDKVVNFGGGIGNKRLLQESNFSGGSRADDHHDHQQQHLHLGSSNNGFVTTDNGAKLSHGVQW